MTLLYHFPLQETTAVSKVKGTKYSEGNEGNLTAVGEITLESKDSSDQPLSDSSKPVTDGIDDIVETLADLVLTISLPQISGTFKHFAYVSNDDLVSGSITIQSEKNGNGIFQIEADGGNGHYIFFHAGTNSWYHCVIANTRLSNGNNSSSVTWTLLDLGIESIFLSGIDTPFPALADVLNSGYHVSWNHDIFRVENLLARHIQKLSGSLPNALFASFWAYINDSWTFVTFDGTFVAFNNITQTDYSTIFAITLNPFTLSTPAAGQTLKILDLKFYNSQPTFQDIFKHPRNPSFGFFQLSHSSNIGIAGNQLDDSLAVFKHSGTSGTQDQLLANLRIHDIFVHGEITCNAFKTYGQMDVYDGNALVFRNGGYYSYIRMSHNTSDASNYNGLHFYCNGDTGNYGNAVFYVGGGSSTTMKKMLAINSDGIHVHGEITFNSDESIHVGGRFTSKYNMPTVALNYGKVFDTGTSLHNFNGDVRIFQETLNGVPESGRVHSNLEFWTSPHFGNGDNGTRNSGTIRSGFDGGGWENCFISLLVAGSERLLIRQEYIRLKSDLYVDDDIHLGSDDGVGNNYTKTITTKGALVIEAAEGTTDDSFIHMDIRCGNSTTKSFIELTGGYSNTDYQYIRFATKNTERLKITHDGILQYHHGTIWNPSAYGSVKLKIHNGSSGSNYWESLWTSAHGMSIHSMIREHVIYIPSGHGHYWGNDDRFKGMAFNMYDSLGEGSQSDSFDAGTHWGYRGPIGSNPKPDVMINGHLLVKGNIRCLGNYAHWNNKIAGEGSVTFPDSDDRLKLNEQVISDVSPLLSKLRPQVYDKLTALDGNVEDAVFESGLIAQEIWYDCPELRHLVKVGEGGKPADVIETSSDPSVDPDYSSWGPEPASVNYTGFIPYLIRGFQEQHEEVDALKKENAEMKAQIAMLMKACGLVDSGNVDSA